MPPNTLKSSLLVFTVVAFASISCFSQRTNTYVETREWLHKAEASPANEPLKKLFLEGDKRIDDLIKCLGDKDQNVNLYAQRIIQYLADPKGVAAIANRSKWCNDTCSWPVMNVLAKPKLLNGTEEDPAKILKRNLKMFEAAKFNEEDISIKLVAYNKRAGVALFEIVTGRTFTTGWHSALQRKDGKWWLISDSLIWQS